MAWGRISDYLDQQARLVPLLLRELEQGRSDDGPQPTDPEVLGQIDAPVLVLLGKQSRLSNWFSESARHVIRHVADPHLRELPDVGHLAPIVAPEPVAKELISFFASVRRPETG